MSQSRQVGLASHSLVDNPWCLMDFSRGSKHPLTSTGPHKNQGMLFNPAFYSESSNSSFSANNYKFATRRLRNLVYRRELAGYNWFYNCKYPSGSRLVTSMTLLISACSSKGLTDR